LEEVFVQQVIVQEVQRFSRGGAEVLQLRWCRAGAEAGEELVKSWCRGA
jgi:hypothetical protein